MSVYGASFVRMISESESSMGEICQLLEERNRAWLAASPDHLAVEHTLRLHGGSPWLSIENAADGEILQRVSRALHTESLTIYAIDEHHLEFHYRHWNDGELVRTLDYADRSWTTVEGKVQPWEAVLLEPRLLAAYDKYAPAKERDELLRQRTIILGSSIPWACDGEVIDRIAKHIGLPWQPSQSRFPGSTQSRAIAGSPERWKRFLREQRRPRWRVW